MVWFLVLVAALLAPRPLPRSAPGIAAIGGLVVIAGWTGLSIAWAPIAGDAADSFVRVLVYLGALVAAAAVLRPGLALKAVEPVLALGSLVVIAYGLVGRLLPGMIRLDRSDKAGGRLEQPITYWNAEGALAAVGLVLCVRLAGSPSRPLWLRVGAAGACAPLGAGVYLSYSRGALAALAVGVVVLLAAAPTRAQARAALICVLGAAVAALCFVGFRGVSSLEGPLSAREGQGIIVIGLLGLTVLATAAAQWFVARREVGGTDRLRFARRLPAVAGVAIAICLAGLVAGGLGERASNEGVTAERGNAARLASVQSRRYDYWRVGLAEWRDAPLRGYGAAGFRVAWLRERPVREQALEIHSLPLEMAVELGLVGLLGFVALVGGVGVAARRSVRSGSVLAPGLVAGTTVWLLHAAIDWDWQLPAVTLPAILMSGALLGAQRPEPSGSSFLSRA